MKNKIISLLITLVVSVICSGIVSAQTPTVTNVTFSQRTDGSHIVDVYYDVNNSGGGAMSVAMEVSDDNGVTWNFPCVQITGDVGAGITSGIGKQIVWNFGAEHPNKFEDQMRVKITAASAGAGVPCPGIPTVTYEGKTYNTVQIGTQCWLKENLDVGIMLPGNQGSANNSVIEKYCYLNNPNYCTSHGGLYQYYEAVQYSTAPGVQGICPTGWHVPTIAEFQTLTAAVNNNGNELKREDQGSGAGQGTNTSGFSALLAGIKIVNGNFADMGVWGRFWTSSWSTSMLSFDVRLPATANNIYYYNTSNGLGLSIRCVKD